MSKITRKKLARGTELVAEHVNAPRAARTQLSTTNIESDQTAAPYSEFSINLNFPWLDSKYFHDNDEGKDPFYMAFCLPPVQEQFGVGGVTPRGTGAAASVETLPVLEEILFSFDQRDTRAATASYWYGKNKVAVSGGSGASTATIQYQNNALPTKSTVFSPNPYEGFLMYDRPEALNFRLSIYSKPQLYFEGTSASTKPSAEVLNFEIPPEAFTAGFNPFVISGLHETFDPYKTYIIALFAPDLHDSRETHQSSAEVQPPAVTSGGTPTYRFSQHAALISPWISLRFKSKTLSRTTPTATAVQNAPAATQAAATGDTGMATITAPSGAGSVIRADDDASDHTGLQHGIQTIDQTLREKLRSGYDFHAEMAPSEHLKDSCGYEVISVPMMQGLMHNRLNPWEAWRSIPYAWPVSGSTGRERGMQSVAYMDRRVIPITDPLELHHVVACLNFTSDRIGDSGDATTSIAPPLNANLSGEVGNFTQYEPAQFPGAHTPSGGSSTPLFKYQIGVALVTGLPGDEYRYQQLAFVEYDYTNGTGSNYLIDAVDLDLAALRFTDSSYTKPFEQALVSVPLVCGVAANKGTGFWSNYGAQWTPGSTLSPTGGTASKTNDTTTTVGGQGRPIFLGGGSSMNAAQPLAGSIPRSQIGSNAGTPAMQDVYTRGMEQYLEIRMAVIPQVSDTFEIDIQGSAGDIVFSRTAHGLSTGDVIYIEGCDVSGRTARPYVKDNFWVVIRVDADNFMVSEYRGQTDTGDAKESTSTIQSGDDRTGTFTVYGNPNNVVVGYGGNFVYLIGKKHLRG